MAGGFPEAQGLDTATRYQLLRDYVDVAMLRDVVERHAVSNVVGLRWLVRHLLNTAAGLFSVEKFYGALKSQGIAISKDTVHQLMGYLQDCFLVRNGLDGIRLGTATHGESAKSLSGGSGTDSGLRPYGSFEHRACIGDGRAGGNWSAGKQRSVM